jgi:hypothetical protein
VFFKEKKEGRRFLRLACHNKPSMVQLYPVSAGKAMWD